MVTIGTTMANSLQIVCLMLMRFIVQKGEVSIFFILQACLTFIDYEPITASDPEFSGIHDPSFF